MAEQTFQYFQRVSYALCTIGNHVYYSRYLDILEAARGEFFRHLALPFLELQQRELIFPVIECHLKYKAPARYDDLLAVSIWVMLAERARLNFGYRVTNQTRSDTLILEAVTLHVCTGLDEKPRRLPEELKQKLAPFISEGWAPLDADSPASQET